MSSRAGPQRCPGAGYILLTRTDAGFRYQTPWPDGNGRHLPDASGRESPFTHFRDTRCLVHRNRHTSRGQRLGRRHHSGHRSTPPIPPASRGNTAHNSSSHQFPGFRQEYVPGAWPAIWFTPPPHERAQFMPARRRAAPPTPPACTCPGVMADVAAMQLHPCVVTSGQV